MFCLQVIWTEFCMVSMLKRCCMLVMRILQFLVLVMLVLLIQLSISSVASAIVICLQSDMLHRYRSYLIPLTECLIIIHHVHAVLVGRKFFSLFFTMYWHDCLIDFTGLYFSASCTTLTVSELLAILLVPLQCIFCVSRNCITTEFSVILERFLCWTALWTQVAHA